MSYHTIKTVVPVDVDHVHYGQWLEISMAHGYLPEIKELPPCDEDVASLQPECIRELIVELQARATTNKLRTFGFNFLSRDQYNNPEFKETLRFCVDYSDYIIARDRVNWKTAVTKAVQEVLQYNIANYAKIYPGVYHLLDESLKKKILPLVNEREKLIYEINRYYGWKAQSAYRFEPNWAGDNMNKTGFTLQPEPMVQQQGFQQPQPQQPMYQQPPQQPGYQQPPMGYPQPQQPRPRYVSPEELRRNAPPPLPMGHRPLTQEQQNAYAQSQASAPPPPAWNTQQQRLDQQAPSGFAGTPMYQQQQPHPSTYNNYPNNPPLGQQAPPGFAGTPMYQQQPPMGQQAPPGFAGTPMYPQQPMGQQPFPGFGGTPIFQQQPMYQQQQPMYQQPPMGQQAPPGFAGTPMYQPQQPMYQQQPMGYPNPSTVNRFYGNSAVNNNGMFGQPQAQRGILQEDRKMSDFYINAPQQPGYQQPPQQPPQQQGFQQPQTGYNPFQQQQPQQTQQPGFQQPQQQTRSQQPPTGYPQSQQQPQQPPQQHTPENPLVDQYQARAYTVDPNVKPEESRQPVNATGARVQSLFGTAGIPSLYNTGVQQQTHYHPQQAQSAPAPTTPQPAPEVPQPVVSTTPPPFFETNPYQELFNRTFNVVNSRPEDPERPCDKIIANDPKHPDKLVIIMPASLSGVKKTFTVNNPHSKVYDRSRSVLFHLIHESTGFVSEIIVNDPQAPMDYLLHETEPTLKSGLPDAKNRTGKIVPLDDAFSLGSAVYLEPMEEQTPEYKKNLTDHDNVLVLDKNFKGTSVEQIDVLVNIELTRNNLFDEWDHRPVQYFYTVLSPYFNTDIMVNHWLKEDEVSGKDHVTTLAVELKKLSDCRTLDEYHRRLNWLYTGTQCPTHIIATLNNQSTEAFNTVLKQQLNMDGWAIDSFLMDWVGLDNEPSLRESLLEEYDEGTTNALIERLDKNAAGRIILGGASVVDNAELADEFTPEGALSQFVGMEKLVVVLGKRHSVVRVPYTSEQLTVNLEETAIISNRTTPQLCEFLNDVKNNVVLYPGVERLHLITRDRIVLEVDQTIYNAQTTLLIPTNQT